MIGSAIKVIGASAAIGLALAAVAGRLIAGPAWRAARIDPATGATRFFAFLLGAATPGPANVIRMMFDPNALRPLVSNWEAVAEALIRRIHREAVSRVRDEVTKQLLDEILAFPRGASFSSRPAG
jgi:hypothetical protein